MVGWTDKKKMMVGGIQKQMVGWIAKIDRWLDEQEKQKYGCMDIKMVGWMDKTNRWMVGRKTKYEKNRWMVGWRDVKNRWMVGWIEISRWMVGWISNIDGWMDKKQMDGWMDGQKKKQIKKQMDD